MSYEIPESFKPIFCYESSNELNQTFHRLFHEAHELFNQHEDVESRQAAAVVLHQSVTREVSAYPVLARTVCEALPQWSLLEVFYEKTGNACQETIQFLIERIHMRCCGLTSIPEVTASQRPFI